LRHTARIMRSNDSATTNAEVRTLNVRLNGLGKMPISLRPAEKGAFSIRLMCMASDFESMSTFESDAAAQLGQRTYTRDEIAQLCAAHRQGAYAGRELEWARQEVDIYRTQREGRVFGGTDVHG